jgi:hypothetical protein
VAGDFREDALLWHALERLAHRTFFGGTRGLQEATDMLREQRPWMVMIAAALLACATAPGPIQDARYGMKDDGAVWVRGPWDAILPASDVDDVIDQLCPAVMQLPRATARDYGQEYCGLLYRMPDGQYYSSHAAPFGKTLLLGPSRKKTCRVPIEVRDGRGSPDIRADFHMHPWNGSPMSPDDLLSKNQLFSIRIQFDVGCRVLKYIPFKGEERPGELYERQGKKWILRGLVKPEDKATGKVTGVAQ